MVDQEMRDRDFRLLGRIRTRADGIVEARDADGRLKGSYNPRTNETRDAGGSLIGRGDWLSSLIRGS